ncbi:FAD/NAD(P)-binding domain-containing protein [Xylariaceae sp. AK1471]|nr:FAD/NAD(P)-binding domain-containing protein [Xylariaceae sp. AK1471]
MEALFLTHLSPLVSPTSKSSQSSPQAASSSHSNDFSKYPYIIIGSGMGGGMVTRKLMCDDDDSGDSGKQKPRVLLLEKGGLQFHTHCLNTSRKHFPHKSQDGRGRDNEVMFDRYLSMRRTMYSLKKESEKSICGGGSVFELGGRSLFWSLETPSIRDDRLKHFSPKDVVGDLEDTTTSTETQTPTGETITITQTSEGWYTKAMRILTNSPPGDVNYPQQHVSTQTQDQVSKAKSDLAQALGGFKTSSIGVQSTPNGAEFADTNNLYYFAQNAYSTTDWIQDRAFNQPVEDDLPLAASLYASAEKLTVKNSKVTGLDITVNNKNVHFDVSEKQKVILCAGTVNTAAIALRSDGLSESVRKEIGKNLTDHEIWMTRYWRKIGVNEYKAQKAVELSCYITAHGHEALLTVCLHAEKFYGHGFADGNGYTDANVELVNVLNIMFEFEAELNTKGAVTLNNNEPLIEINHNTLDSSPDFKTELTTICKAIRKKFGFVEGSSEGGFTDKVMLAKWGSVAHEVGTMRMDSPSDNKGVVDSNLRVKGVDNLFVCDLSVFPCSPMENPSLTLTALAMRLAAHLKKLEGEKDGGSTNDQNKTSGGSGGNTGLGKGGKCWCDGRKPPPYTCNPDCWKFAASTDF